MSLATAVSLFVAIRGIKKMTGISLTTAQKLSLFSVAFSAKNFIMIERRQSTTDDGQQRKNASVASSSTGEARGVGKRRSGSPQQQPQTSNRVMMEIERKRFTFTFDSNQNGSFLKITEESGGRSSVIVPTSGLGEFTRIVNKFNEKFGDDGTTEKNRKKESDMEKKNQ